MEGAPAASSHLPSTEGGPSQRPQLQSWGDPIWGQSRCNPLPPPPMILHLEGVVHMQHAAVKDGRAHGGDPKCPALPQRPPPRAHRLARETGHHSVLLLAGASRHEGLRLDHDCSGQHRARGAVVNLSEHRDYLTCNGKWQGLSFPTFSPDTGPPPHLAAPASYLVCSPCGRSWLRGRRGHGYCTRIGRSSPELLLAGPYRAEEKNINGSLCGVSKLSPAEGRLGAGPSFLVSFSQSRKYL